MPLTSIANMAGRTNPFAWRQAFLAGKTGLFSDDAAAAQKEMTEICEMAGALIKKCADQRMGDYGRLIATMDTLQATKDTFSQALAASSAAN